MTRQTFPVVLSAPSGTGKTTLAHLLVDSMPNLKISISYTTRLRRGNERNGMDYHFITEDIYNCMEQKQAFLESAEVHGYKYGSGAKWTAQTLADGYDVLFDIDVQGGLQIKASYSEALLIFVLPPSIDVLKNRLRARGTDSNDRIKRRIDAAANEINVGLDRYDYIINNENLDRALFDLTSIIRTHRLQKFDREKIRRRLLGH